MSWPNSSRAAQLVMAQSATLQPGCDKTTDTLSRSLSNLLQMPALPSFPCVLSLPFYTFDTFTWLILPPKIAVDPAIGKNSKIRSSMKHVNVETAGLRADVKRI